MQAVRGQVGWGGIRLSPVRTREQNQWWKETSSGSIKKNYLIICCTSERVRTALWLIVCLSLKAVPEKAGKLPTTSAES